MALPYNILAGHTGSAVIVDNITDTEGNVQTVTSSSFTIAAPVTPTISISAPTTGVSWVVGTTQSITWTAADSSGSSVKLNYTVKFSADGGSNWANIATLVGYSQGSNTYSWSVADPVSFTTNDSGNPISPAWTTPTTSTPSSNCEIEIIVFNPYSCSSNQAISNTFVITAPNFPVTTQSVTLYPGWNLVSLPLVPTNSNIQNVLGTAINSIVSVWTCAGGGSTGGTWSSWSPGFSSNLSTMVDGKAYWINTNLTTGQIAIFTFQGRVGNPPPSAPPSYTYPAGWNMVGFTFSPSSGEQVQQYLGTQNTTSANYNLPVIGYNANPADTPGFTTLSGTTPNMLPGLGYWVFYNTAGTRKRVNAVIASRLALVADLNRAGKSPPGWTCSRRMIRLNRGTKKSISRS